MTAALARAEGRFSESRIDDEVVLMQIDSGEFFSLSGTAAAIWELIDGTRNRATLVAELAERYDADPTHVGSDVDAFLAKLGAAGLVTGG